MQAHILSLHTPWVPGVESKYKNIFFLREAILHIKLNGMEIRAPCKHIFCPSRPPKPVGRVKRLKKSSECGHVAYLIIGKEVWTNKETDNLTLHTHYDLWVRLNGQILYDTQGEMGFMFCDLYVSLK